MQLNIMFDLDQQVYALMPNGSPPTNIITGNISRVDVTAQVGQSQVESYYIFDGAQNHIVPKKRIFTTQQAAQDVLDIINA